MPSRGNDTALKCQHWLTRQRLIMGSWSLLILFATFGGYFFYYILLDNNAPQEKEARDFITYYAASKLALLGEPLAAYDRIRLHAMEQEIWPKSGLFPWFYPPTYLLVVLPLGLTSYIMAIGLFLIINVVFFLIAVRRWIPDSAALFPILAFPAVLTNIIFVQNGLLTASLALLSLYYLQPRPRLAGVFIGLLAIKPHLAVLFPLALLLGRHREAFISATLTLIVFVLVSTTYFGTDIWHAFFGALTSAQQNLVTNKLKLDLMISPFASVLALTNNISLSYLIQIIFCLGFVTVMIIIWLSTTDIYLRGASFALATLNCSPYLFDYEMSWVSIPIALLSVRGLKHGWISWEREILILAWLFPGIEIVLVMLTPTGTTWPSPLFISELLLLFLVIQKWRQTHDRTSKPTAQ